MTDQGEPVSVPRSLPRGAHGLQRDVVLMSQRARLVEAVARIVARDGYANARVQDIIRHARVSRTTFYEQFADKEDCFLAAYSAGARAHFEHVGAAVRRGRPAVERLLEATEAYLEVLVAEPDFASTFLVQIHAAGARALEARTAVHRRYAELFRLWYRDSRDELQLASGLPDEVFDATVSTLDSIVAEHVRAGRLPHLMELAPALVYMELALLGASERPMALVRSVVPDARPAA